MSTDMSNENTLDSLVHQLSAEERTNMLGKISSMMEENQEQPTFVNDAEKHAAITEYTEKIYDKKGFLYKLQIFLSQIFSGETKSEAVTRMELQNTLHDIKTHYGTLIDTRNNSLTGVFLKEFVKLAKLCDSVKTVLEKTLFDSEFYIKFVSQLLENYQSDSQRVLAAEAYPNALTKKGDITTKNDYTNEKDKRIKRYFNAIELPAFDNLNSMLKRYEIISRLIKFDFRHFFLNFSVSDIDATIPQDASCKYIEIEDQLSRLFRLIISVTFEISDVGIFLSLLDWSKEEGNGTDDENSFTQDTYNKIESIIDACKQLRHRVPMQNIMVCLKSELLYKLTPVEVNYDVTLIYKEYKRTILDKVWNEYFVTLKKENLSFMASEMFNQEYNYHTLRYLTPHFKQQMERMHFITLPYIYRLNLMVEFLSTAYKGKIEPVLSKIINDGDFKKEKVRNDITSYYYLMSNYEQRVRDFDEKYNPNKETGKLLHQYLNNTGKDEEATSNFVNMIDQINIECQNFISELTHSFKLIDEFLVTVNDVHNPHNIPIINSDKIKIPGQPNLFVAVERSVTLFNKFNLMIEMANDVFK